MRKKSGPLLCKSAGNADPVPAAYSSRVSGSEFSNGCLAPWSIPTTYAKRALRVPKSLRAGANCPHLAVVGMTTNETSRLCAKSDSTRGTTIDEYSAEARTVI